QAQDRLGLSKRHAGADAWPDAERHVGELRWGARTARQEPLRNKMVRLLPKLLVPMQQPRRHHDHRAFGNRLTLEFLVLAGLAGQERHRRIESKHFVDDRARVDKPRHVGERWQPSAEYRVKLGM